jgi:hypothetical protein
MLIFFQVNAQSALEKATFNGRFHYLFPVIKEAGSEDFSNKKAEFYISATNFYTEVDVYPDNPVSADLVKIDQAYIKLEIHDQQLKIGLMESGIGKMKYYSINTPVGVMDKEVEGMGLFYNYKIFKLGNFGNFGADESNNNVDRVLFAAIDVKEYLPVKAGLWYTTDPLEKESDLDAAIAFHYNLFNALDLNANLRKTLLNNITSTPEYFAAGISANYEVIANTDIYSSYSLGLNDETRENNLENDLIFGISHKIVKGVKVALEYQNSQIDQEMVKDDLSLAFEVKF